MNILAAIRRERRKLEKQVGKLQRELDGLTGQPKHSVALRRTDLVQRKKSHVCCGESKDFSSREETMGEGEGGSEEGGELAPNEMLSQLRCNRGSVGLGSTYPAVAAVMFS
jgi:hypothetical protein